MPSIHVGWAAVVALAAVTASRNPWHWVGFAHLSLTMFVVAATGHHWWADGVVVVALLLVGLRLDIVVRGRAANRTSLRKITEPTGSVSLPLSFDTVLPEQPIVQGRPSSTAREHP